MRIIEISPMFKCNNCWSCIPSAFALALGIPVAKIIKSVGHDGSEIIHPEENDPRKRKSFVVQEMIDFCFSQGMFITGIEAVPSSTLDGKNIYAYEKVSWYKNNEERIVSYLHNYKGVLTGFHKNGQRHAVHWDGEKVVDPNGYQYCVEEFEVECFWIIGNRSIMGMKPNLKG